MKHDNLTSAETKKEREPRGLRRTPMKRGKRVNPRSEKMTEAMEAYKPLRDLFLMRHRECQVRARGCTRWTQDLHHRKGRLGELLLDEAWFAACCRSCHSYVHEHGEWARKNGWLVPRSAR